MTVDIICRLKTHSIALGDPNKTYAIAICVTASKSPGLVKQLVANSACYQGADVREIGFEGMNELHVLMKSSNSCHKTMTYLAVGTLYSAGV